MKTLKLLPIGIVLGMGSVANAVTLIHESFSQTPGALNGQAGGSGLSGNWSDNQTVDVVSPTTLSYGQVANFGGQLDMTNGSGVDAWVSTSSILGDNSLLDNGAELWFSYMYSKDSNGGSNEKGGFALGTERLDGAFNRTNMSSGGNGIGVRAIGTSVNAATWSGGGDASVGGSIGISLSTSYLVVGRINWGATAGDDETITLFLPPTSDINNLGAGVSHTMTGVDQTAFDTISMTQRNSGGTVSYDEIRFGATQDDVLVVPEPSSALLFSFGGLLLTLRRRR